MAALLGMAASVPGASGLMSGLSGPIIESKLPQLLDMYLPKGLALVRPYYGLVDAIPYDTVARITIEKLRSQYPNDAVKIQEIWKKLNTAIETEFAKPAPPPKEKGWFGGKKRTRKIRRNRK